MTTTPAAPRRTRARPRPLAALIDEVRRRAGGDLDEEEAVHDLRVACRRLEAGTRVNEGVLARKRLRDLRRAAKAIRRAFDQARDLEVIAAEVKDVSGLSGGFRDGIREAAQHQAASAEAAGRIGAELKELEQTRARLTENDVPAREALAGVLVLHIAAFFDEAERLLPESTDDALHELRIGAKKLRYEMEIGRPVFRRLAAQVRRMKRLQDILGRHQDAAVGLHWAENLAADELGAAAEDRATLMRYYAALRRAQRSRLRRLLTGWQQRGIRGRVLAAVGT